MEKKKNRVTVVCDLNSQSDQQDSNSSLPINLQVLFIYYSLNKAFNIYIYLFTKNNYHLYISLF